MAKKKFGYEHNPLTVLIKILSNALLDDPLGIPVEAFNALLVLTDLVDKSVTEELQKKSFEIDGRVRYKL